MRPLFLHRLTRKLLLRSLLVLFCARALVPVGYMPAARADGGPFTLCHGTSAPTLALIAQAGEARQPAHQHDSMAHAGMPVADVAPGTDFPSRHYDLWDRCPLGTGASDAPLAPAFELVIAEHESFPEFLFVEVFLPVLVAPSYRARAPPVLISA